MTSRAAIDVSLASLCITPLPLLLVAMATRTVVSPVRAPTRAQGSCPQNLSDRDWIGSVWGPPFTSVVWSIGCDSPSSSPAPAAPDFYSWIFA